MWLSSHCRGTARVLPRCPRSPAPTPGGWHRQRRPRPCLLCLPRRLLPGGGHEPLSLRLLWGCVPPVHLHPRQCGEVPEADLRSLAGSDRPACGGASVERGGVASSPNGREFGGHSRARVSSTWVAGGSVCPSVASLRSGGRIGSATASGRSDGGARARSEECSCVVLQCSDGSKGDPGVLCAERGGEGSVASGDPAV